MRLLKLIHFSLGAEVGALAPNFLPIPKTGAERPHHDTSSRGPRSSVVPRALLRKKRITSW